MILIDTSIWVDHLRAVDPAVVRLLESSRVLGHPWVAGELGLGQLSQREEVLALLGWLPQATVASETELAGFVERHRLWGRGIGYVDAQLLASTLLTADALLWTRDKRLTAVADELGCSCPDG